MKLRILSDLHTEIYPYEVEKMPEDQETILILAGDCGLFKHIAYADFINEVAPSFRKVVMVAGNHEYYAGKFPTEKDKFLERISGCDNVHILQDDAIDIDGVLFVGGTLWTSFRNGNPLVMMDAEAHMNDYSRIRMAKNGYRRLKALDVLEQHTATRNFIFDTLEKEKDNYDKIVVVTHHAPSCKSIASEYVGDRMNDMYVNNFEYWVQNIGPMYWFHGHIHNSMDYMLGDTRVICNPRGYVFRNKNGEPVTENMSFNPTMTLEV